MLNWEWRISFLSFEYVPYLGRRLVSVRASSSTVLDLTCSLLCASAVDMPPFWINAQNVVLYILFT